MFTQCKAQEPINVEGKKGSARVYAGTITINER